MTILNFSKLGGSTQEIIWGVPGGGPCKNPRSLSSPRAEKFEFEKKNEIFLKNKNKCSVAATGPPIFEGPRENPKSLSSSKAEKFDFLFLHSVL